MKRFYKNVVVASSESGFGIRLDERELLTPSGNRLATPKRALSETIAQEWSAQGEDIRPQAMPLMQMAATVLDQLPRQRANMAERLLSYIDTDLLCLRAEEPSELRRHQETQWQPPLDWLKNTHRIELKTGTGLKIPPQSSGARLGFDKKLHALDDWTFMGMHEAASSSGSLVLALALLEGAYSAEEIFELAELESLFQAQRWGMDAEMEKRHNAIRAELNTIARWLTLLKL